MSLLVMKEAFNVLKDHRKRDDEFMTRQAKFRFDNAIAALRHAICEAESQAPLAYIKNDGKTEKLIWQSDKADDGCSYEPLYTEPIHVRDLLHKLVYVKENNA
jgi:hypothetical protein